MKNSLFTRRMMLVTVTGLAAAPVALAQDPPPGGGRRPGGARGNQLEEMKKRLNLTADQEEKIKGIYEGQMKQMQELRENADPNDRKAMREKMMKLRQDTNAKVLDVLNDEQKEEFKKMQEEMMQNMRNRRGGRGGGQAPQQ